MTSILSKQTKYIYLKRISMNESRSITLDRTLYLHRASQIQRLSLPLALIDAMKKILLLIVLFLIGCSTKQVKELKISEVTPEIEKQLNDFVLSEWGKVYKAKDTLMMIEKEVIPHLITLMYDEKRFVKLANTADLIYPGATTFYGSGWFIPYDLDWIAIRAGWALEELTFQNFGFVETSITNVDLIQLHKDNYEEYIKKGKHDVNFERESFKKLSKSIKKATNWWIENQHDWSNKQAIKDALYCDDVERQMNALQHLRFPNYKSKGLNLHYYENELKSRIEELELSSDEEIAEQAKLKLREY